ncbi:MAG: cytochrome b/b6 domain-containing protein [Cyanobacteria bacterium J069]|nr:MAG: cytochrome b/b6 domain-containing protein [Cyanobacteria bacterium J069]
MPSRPYQPLLLRILHGVTGLSAIAAILTAAWTFDTYDARWIDLPLPRLPEIEGIHGTFGLYALLAFPLLVLYAFRQGDRRLAQPDSFNTLTRMSPARPAWWYALHRCTNTTMLLAMTFALFSGKMMDSNWLPRGETHHAWYLTHLVSWVVLVVCLGLHLLMAAKVGGQPLLVSMLEWQFREKDHPKRWPSQIAATWNARHFDTLRGWLAWAKSLRLLEAGILLAIAFAWIIPLFKHP